jgi:hypothetical protein
VHVKNVGNSTLPSAPVRVTADGRVIFEGLLKGLDRFESGYVDIDHPQDGVVRTLLAEVNAKGEFGEVHLANNTRELRTDALRVGLWIEKPVAWGITRVEPAFDGGTSCMEDWAQRQIGFVNDLLRRSVHEGLPGGVDLRIGVDQVRVVEENDLPLWGGNSKTTPDSRDETVDIAWGVPAFRIEAGLLDLGAERRSANPLWKDVESMHLLLEGLGLAGTTRGDVSPAELPPGGNARGRSAEGEGFLAGDEEASLGLHDAMGLVQLAATGRVGRTGAYLADLPQSCGIRVLGADGEPLDGVRVEVTQRRVREGGTTDFLDGPARSGVTIEGGFFDLCDRGIDPWFGGEKDVDDPRRSVIYITLRHGDEVRRLFLDTDPWNLAFWHGETDRHDVDVRTDLER